MLDEYRQMYATAAEPIAGWKSMDKNELCRAYTKFENDPVLRDAYLSAIICRYWNLIPKFYNISKNLAEPLDCYNWLIDAILYALKHRRWEDDDASIAKDPKGPDKMINRCMKSSRLTYYQFCNRKKRRKEYQIVSIDELKETMNSDAIDIEDTDANIDLDDLDIIYCIRDIFNRKEYFLAFSLDCVLNESVFDTAETGEITFNIKKLAKAFRSIDEDYLKRFSSKYDLDYDNVYQAAILAKNVPQAKLIHKLEETLLRLKHSNLVKYIMEVSLC